MSGRGLCRDLCIAEGKEVYTARNRYLKGENYVFFFFKKPVFIHIYFDNLLYISSIETNYKPLQQLIQERRVPKLIYRLLSTVNNPPLPKLAYRLFYNHSSKRPSVYINFGKKLLHTKGHLTTLEPGKEFVVKLNLIRTYSFQSELKPYHHISLYHKRIGHKLYDYIVIQSKAGDLTIKDQLLSYPLSLSALFHIFKQVIGVTPNIVRRDRRLLNFKRALVSTGYSISNLILDSGFKSRSHLHELFLRNYDMTPSQFRRVYGSGLI